MEQLEKQFSGMCLIKIIINRTNIKNPQNKNKSKHNFSETTFETNQDARSYETHEPLHRTKSR